MGRRKEDTFEPAKAPDPAWEPSPCFSARKPENENERDVELEKAKRKGLHPYDAGSEDFANQTLTKGVCFFQTLFMLVD